MKATGKDWVGQVLNSLDGVEQAKPSPGFYERIVNRIEQGDYVLARNVISMPNVYRIAAGIAFIVALNVYTCITFSKQASVNAETQMQSFAHEFFVTGDSDVY